MKFNAVVTGIVLTSIPIGEYDKRITILTKERGKITAFAKGARRQNSPLMAACNPFSFGEFELYEGRTSYNVMKASISNYFMELYHDLEGVHYGFYFLEIADYYGQENADDIQLLKLLYQSLRALTKETISNHLVRAVFELKALTISGEAPQVFECVHCTSEENLIKFQPSRGGCICKKCMNPEEGISIDESTLYTMQYIIATSVEKLYTFSVTPEVQYTLERILKNYIILHIDRKFKSLTTLEDEMLFMK